MQRVFAAADGEELRGESEYFGFSPVEGIGQTKVTIDGSGHFFADLYGDEAADAIAQFLKKN